MPDFTKREDNQKIPVVHTVHRDVEPVPTKGWFIVVYLPDNFLSGGFCMSDIGAKPCASFLGMGKGKGK